MRGRAIGLGLALLLAIGCGGDDGGIATDASIDAVAPTDAPPVCGVSSADFGDLGERPGVAGVQGSVERQLGQVFIPLTVGDPNDRLVLGIWNGYEFHPEPVTAGVYPLTGDQTASHTCWVCVSLGAMWSEGAGANLDHLYFVTGGTANITRIELVAGGAIEFELTDLTLQHVRVNSGMTSPLDDGCVTAVDRISYRGTFEGGSSLARSF